VNAKPVVVGKSVAVFRFVMKVELQHGARSAKAVNQAAILGAGLGP